MSSWKVARSVKLFSATPWMKPISHGPRCQGAKNRGCTHPARFRYTYETGVSRNYCAFHVWKQGEVSRLAAWMTQEHKVTT